SSRLKKGVVTSNRFVVTYEIAILISNSQDVHECFNIFNRSRCILEDEGERTATSNVNDVNVVFQSKLYQIRELITLIFFVIVGNTFVILSVIIYKRMRTFTNKLLTSLATADLLVGLFVMPLSLLDLLLNHAWPFDTLLCKVWSTSDVLFCTASILNLCVISIDRYLAISKPLKYSRTRNLKTAALLLGSVWVISFIVCTPPWIFHFDDYATTALVNISESTSCSNMIVCDYPSGIMYRIYSSMASFFIPLLLMCSVYFKIFRIVSTREKVLWKSINLKSYGRSSKGISNSQSRDRDSSERYYSHPNGMINSEEESISDKQTTHDLMYSAINVGISALKSNSSGCEVTSDDRSKVFYFQQFLLFSKCINSKY
uniref:G_PROTEIN_RECEP_F1_2 domain-containing protein n=1 Tax=Elaeophora elaphi TaxID=1147741 RepID=A0A0R3RLN2_9BILA